MVNTSNFNQNLAGMLSAGKKLPPLKIKDNTEFGQAMNDITRSIRLPEPQEGVNKTVAEVASEFSSAFFSSLYGEGNEDKLAKFNAIVDAFSGVISGGVNCLVGAKAKAEELSARMEAAVKEMIAKDQFMSHFMDNGDGIADIAFKDIPWNVHTLIAPQPMIIDEVNTSVISTDAEAPAEPTNALFALAVEKLDPEVATDIVLSDEVKANIITLLKQCNESLSEGDLSIVLRVLTSKRELVGIKNALRNIGTDIAKIPENVIMCLDTIKMMIPVMDCISTQIALSEETKTQFLTNIEVARREMLLFAYFAILHRLTTFSSSIVIRGGFINYDNRKAFENAKGEMIMIARYITDAFGGDANKIPMRGIGVETIIATHEATAARLEKDLRNNKLKCDMKLREFRCNAFKGIADNAMREALSAKEELSANEYSIAMNKASIEIKSICGKLQINDILFIDASLEFVINMLCDNNFAKILFRAYGAAYTKQLTIGKSIIEAADVDLCESGAVTELVWKFFKKNFLEEIQ